MFCANPQPGRFFSTRCRKCPPCVSLRREGWVERTVWEVMAADKAIFITLTFRRKPENGYSQFQLYAKRVRTQMARKGWPGAKLRYICAAEYGERKGRYHLHGIFAVHGGNPPIHFFRGKWIGGITHARQIHAGHARRTSRYVAKYLAKAGRIRASNGFGTGSATQERILRNAGPIAAAIADAFPGAQAIGVREEKGGRTQQAPYRIRRDLRRARLGTGYVQRERPLGGLGSLPTGPLHGSFSEIWGDYLAIGSVRADLAQAEWQLRLISSDSEESEESETEE